MNPMDVIDKTKKELKKTALIPKIITYQEKMFFEMCASPRKKLWIPPFVRSAVTQDYNRWLFGFIMSGQKPTNYLNFSASCIINSFFVAVQNFSAIPLYGEYAVKIIVPKHIDFLGGELGDCLLYFEKNFQFSGRIRWIPLFECQEQESCACD